MRILAEIYHKRGNTKHASKLGQEVLDVLDRHRQSLVQGQPETMHTIGDFVVTLKACGLEAEADGLEADSADYRAQQRSQHA
ncbi:hypothetical protein FRC19_007502 [Serendipita sp. 401]|nr:hypothetical protein FRC15_008439 [Serendipita sp. 397]KAG8806031.1 hypothetical protein FRC19_007502 [Serendipita sp. 401]KAG8833290.1 hypothetical protein FRC20_007703 [Serendipita sp. 405]